jgi:hypothetical protein
VTDYVERAVPVQMPAPDRLQLTQEGLMWLRPGGPPRPFSATQEISVDRVEFTWRARFPLLPLLSLHVLDGLAAGAGELDVRFLGLTLQRQRGPETSVGEAMRYLAELPWAPHAMTCNRDLHWRQDGPRSLAVSTPVAGQPTEVTFELDQAGDIVQASSAARPYRQGNAWTLAGWTGTFARYRTLGGIRMPTRAEVSWLLPEGRFVYFQARIRSAIALGGLA